MTPFAESIGIVSADFMFEIMLTIMMTAGLIGIGLGWLKRTLFT